MVRRGVMTRLQRADAETDNKTVLSCFGLMQSAQTPGGLKQHQAALAEVSGGLHGT